MTQGSPVEVIRAPYATVEDADHAGMRGLLASDLRWRRAASVVATGSYHGRHRDTGRELHAECCHVGQVRDGVASGFRQYTDTAAVAAAMDVG